MDDQRQMVRYAKIRLVSERLRKVLSDRAEGRPWDIQGSVEFRKRMSNLESVE